MIIPVLVHNFSTPIWHISQVDATGLHPPMRQKGRGTLRRIPESETEWNGTVAAVA